MLGSVVCVHMEVLKYNKELKCAKGGEVKPDSRAPQVTEGQVDTKGDPEGGNCRV